MSNGYLPSSAFEALQLPADSVSALTSAATNNGNSNSPPSSSSIVLPPAPSTTLTDLPSNSACITLYAELLLNIRTVTLFASLRSVHNCETKVQLSADGTSITLSHEGESASIRLPMSIQGGGDASLCLPAEPPSKELTLRLQLQEKESAKLLARSSTTEERKWNWVPWGAGELNGKGAARIVCRECGAEFVGSGKVKEWKDLPNENWAEMMDFWHCHKPSEHHHRHGHEEEGEIGKSKGYAAANQLRAVKGTGFVDLGAFLLRKEDCIRIKAVPFKLNQSDKLLCSTCTAEIGTVDDRAEGWRIYKWSLSVLFCVLDSTAPSPLPPTYSVQKWISAQFLSLIENLGVRKFSVHAEDSDDASSSSLLLWIFTPDLSFSSSVPAIHGDPRTDPTRAMKVFWQSISPTSDQRESLEQQSFSVEEVVFPKHVFGKLQEALEDARHLLPASARRFREWEVGLLERFDEEG